MGISFSINSSGINNINLFGIQKVGNDQVQTLAGIFANVNLNDAPVIKGIFAETSVNGNAINITYATDSQQSRNIQESLRLRLFKDEFLGIDLNFYHNTSMLNSFKFFRFGANICWSFPEGHLMAIGASHSPLFNNSTLDWICKLNLWKSDNQSFNIDLITNLTLYLRGPFAGNQNIVVSLAISYDLLNSPSRAKVLTN